MARADRFEIIDTWHTTGLAGSGSNDYTCRDLFVPAEHTFSLAEPVRHDGPLDAIPGAFSTNMHAVALGLAHRAIDEAIAVVSDKIVMPEGITIRDMPRVREVIADAQRHHRYAEAYASRAVDDAWAQVTAGAQLTVDQRVDLILSRVEAFRMAQDVTAAMVRLVGTQAIYRDQHPRPPRPRRDHHQPTRRRWTGHARRRRTTLTRPGGEGFVAAIV